jgi:5-methylcytosine-specific restriction endonuclease McrA
MTLTLTEPTTLVFNTPWTGIVTRGCTHVALCDVDCVLSQCLPRDDKTKVDFDGYYVKMNSIRYKCFKRSRVCAHCGLVGTVMLLDQSWDGRRPHFNLYAVKDGDLILMTRDHIVPRSKGGLDILDNLQTLCIDCNSEKADK